MGEVFRALQHRLRDSTWTVVFKSLITVHLMIREGSPDVTLAYLAKHRNMLAMSMFSDGQSLSTRTYRGRGPEIHRRGDADVGHIQPRRKAGIYDIMRIIYPNERELTAIQRSTG